MGHVALARAESVLATWRDSGPGRWLAHAHLVIKADRRRTLRHKTFTTGLFQ